MKKIIATLCFVGSTFALTACDTASSLYDENTEPPYAMERTASHGHQAEMVKAKPSMSTPSRVKPAEPMFQRAQEK